jgi:hypothetical protein
MCVTCERNVTQNGEQITTPSAKCTRCAHLSAAPKSAPGLEWAVRANPAVDHSPLGGGAKGAKWGSGGGLWESVVNGYLKALGPSESSDVVCHGSRAADPGAFGAFLSPRDSCRPARTSNERDPSSRAAEQHVTPLNRLFLSERGVCTRQGAAQAEEARRSDRDQTMAAALDKTLHSQRGLAAPGRARATTACWRRAAAPAAAAPPLASVAGTL